MSNAFASALEISARIIRDNLGDPATARRLITERLQNMDHRGTRVDVNAYLRNMEQGFKSVLAGLYSIAQRGES